MSSSIASTSGQSGAVSLSFYDLPEELRTQVLRYMSMRTRMMFYFCSRRTMRDMPPNLIVGLNLSDESLSVELVTGQVESWPQSAFYDVDMVVQRIFDRNPTGLSSVLFDNEWHYSFEKMTIRRLTNLRALRLNFGQHGLMNSGFTDMQQLLRIPEKLYVKYIEMNHEQLLECAASDIVFTNIIITETEINSYLKSFVNGRVRGGQREIRLKFDKNLDTRKIIEGLHTIGKKTVKNQIKFALVSLEQKCRVAKVSMDADYIKILMYPKDVFDRNMDWYDEYGLEVDEYLEEARHFELMDFGDLRI